ncbi:PREDICTED: location of vulva defective 1-like [Nicrophorus vespilloides]|uniref:Location of vulva defective 1-like n=1 Tax=Nicrophorus vespilloides TaxID=110193 RepID=A0ABM1MF61_NICVS|nr:PREDICTED: location of vulva defective 1-like [Nicrophorus vespilloides]
MRSKSSVHKDKIIFLSDNLKNDRYGYLLVVKTGNISSAGTTSNVMIQLFAENCATLAHVLNYPDPNKMLLQRGGEDWLVLTCEKHLGEIKYMQIWFDGVGIRPTWYCEEIFVIDLQTHKEWNFQVDKWFSLRDERSIEYTVPAKVKEIRNTISNLHKRVRFYVDGEHTWNIFAKSHDHFLSYPQRLTVLLSMIMTTYTFGMFLLSPPTLSTSDSFGHGEFNFDFDLILIPTSISLITCTINLPMVYFFRNSYNRVDMYSFFNVDKRYPVIITKLVWCILITWIALCMTYLLVFGYFITKNTAFYWIFSTYSSIVMSIFIFENIYLIVYNILMHRFSKVTKTYYDFNGILREIEMQRKTLFKLFGETLLRPYFQAHYRRWELDLWKKMALLENSRWEVTRLFHDFCIFLIYLLILYVVSFTGYSDLDYLSSKSMYNMMQGSLVEITEDSHFDGNEYYDFSLKRIKAIQDIYDYLNKTLVQNIHPVHWYGKFFLKDGGQMIDFNTKILGVVKLRQQRRKQVCERYSPLDLLPILCSNDNPTFRLWKYDDGANNTISLGKLGLYDGTGYVQNLGRTIYNTYYLIAHLKRANWIDINTKVLIIDFWTYNVNYNIFNMVQVLIERDLSGRIVASEEVYTVRLLYATKFIQIIVTICCLLFIITIIIMIGRSIVLFVKEKKRFFKDFWHIFDIILFILGVIMILLFFYRHKIIKRLMNELSTSNNNHFVNYFPLVMVGRANVFITATLLALATIRLWKFLRFAKVFQIMERTIRRMALDIFIILIYHCFIYIMFALYLHVMFGDSYELFKTVPQTITTLFLISLNFFDHFDHEGLSTYGSTIYLVYSIFMITSVFFTTIYCTIIIIGFEESKIYFSNRSLQYTILDHIKDESVYYREVCKRQNINLRLRAGNDNDDNNSDEFEEEKVTPKEYCKRYADCFTMTNDKMLVMRLVAISIIKLDKDFKMLSNKAMRKEIVEDKMKLMARITLAMMKPKSEKLRANHVFFSGKDPIDNSTRFVSDDVIMQIEYVVKSILEPTEMPTEDHTDVVIHSNENEDRLTKIRDRLNMIHETIGNIRIVSK